MNLTAAIAFLNPSYTHNPIAFIVRRFLKCNGIDIKLDILAEALSKHPHFPTLLSISDVILDFGVKTAAYRISLEELKENFESPILIHLNNGPGLFSILTKINDSTFKVITEKGEVWNLSEMEFRGLWEGVVLDVTEYSPKPIKDSNHLSYPPYLNFLLAISWIFIVFYFLSNQLQNIGLSNALILSFSFAGLFISWLLVLETLNKRNVLVQQLCQTNNEEGCGAVLTNSTAQIISWMSMAEAGFLYFCGLIFLLIFKDYNLIYLLSIVAPIFSLYAIFLQKFVIKEWCKLCMAVHGMILALFIASIYLVNTGEFIVFNSPEPFFIFLLPALIWFVLKPFIKSLRDLAYYQYEYSRVKYNPEIFTTIMKNHPPVRIGENLKKIRLGNEDSMHELTIVSNPYCGPCASAYAVLNEWITNGVDFKVNIVFSHSPSLEDKKRIFAQYIYSLKDREKVKTILETWHLNPDQDLNNWAMKFNLNLAALPYQDSELIDFLETANIQATPTFFINGYKLPRTYQLTDVRYLMNEIHFSTLPT